MGPSGREVAAAGGQAARVERERVMMMMMRREEREACHLHHKLIPKLGSRCRYSIGSEAWPLV